MGFDGMMIFEMKLVDTLIRSHKSNTVSLSRGVLDGMISSDATFVDTLIRSHKSNTVPLGRCGF